jgi:hypothetical protein
LSKKQKQQALLAVLALILVIAAGRRLGSLFSVDSFSGSGGRSSGGRTTGLAEQDWRTTLPEVEELHSSALVMGTEALSEGRDPFQAGRPEPPPRPKPTESDLRQRIEEARQRRTTEVTAPVRPPAPRPPAIDVVYLGNFGNGRRRLAVFTDGSEIFNVPEGDILKDKFVLVKIGMESADLGFVGFPEAPAQRLEIGG